MFTRAERRHVWVDVDSQWWLEVVPPAARGSPALDAASPAMGLVDGGIVAMGLVDDSWGFESVIVVGNAPDIKWHGDNVSVVIKIDFSVE